MAFTIQMTGAKDYVPFEGGGDLYPFEGMTVGTIKSIAEDKSEKGNDTLVFTVACDEAEAKGLVVKKWIPVSGMRKDNKPNVIGLFEALTAIYSMSLEPDKAIEKVRALEGRSFTSAELIQSLTGQKVCYEVEARPFQRDDGSGGWSSNCKNFIMKQKYEDAKSFNNHHRDLPVEAKNRSAAPAAGGGAASNPNPGAGATAGGTAPAPNGAPPSAPKGGALGIL